MSVTSVSQFYPLMWNRMARVGWMAAFLYPYLGQALVNEFLLRAGLVKGRMLNTFKNGNIFPPLSRSTREIFSGRAP